MELLEHLSARTAALVGLFATTPSAIYAAATPTESWFPLATGAAIGTFSFLWAAYKLGSDKMLERTEARLAKAENEIDERIASERNLKVENANLQAELTIARSKA